VLSARELNEQTRMFRLFKLLRVTRLFELLNVDRFKQSINDHHNKILEKSTKDRNVEIENYPILK